MDKQLETVMIISVMLIFSMFIASFNFKELPNRKPSRYAFRAFYICNLLSIVFIVLSISFTTPEKDIVIWKISDFATDLTVSLTYVSLIIGFGWRSNKNVDLRLLAFYALAYILLDGWLLDDWSLFVAYSYSIISTVICMYYVFHREDRLNAGDKGIFTVLFINFLFMVYNIYSTYIYHTTGQVSYVNLTFILFSYTPVYIANLTLFIFSSYLHDFQRQLYLEARTDSMTGLYNRRFFMEHANMLTNNAKRNKLPINYVMCDIDKFKNINDNYGHDIGDEAIISFAQALKAQLREGDLLARFGGEEFIVLLPDTPHKDAMNIAERMRSSTEKIKLETPKGIISFTASFGVSEYLDNSLEDNIKNADLALYQSKTNGRNQVSLFEL